MTAAAMSKLVRGDIAMRIAAPLLVGLLVLAGWEAFCRANDIPAYLFPAPSAIAKTFVSDAPVLLHALWMTLRITFQAFMLAIVIGTAMAFLFVQSRAVEVSLFPYAVLLQVTPIVAIAPLIIILVKNTEVSLVICATVVALFPIVSNTTIGLRSIDQNLDAYFRMNKAGRLQTLWRLRIPRRCRISSPACASLRGWR